MTIQVLFVWFVISLMAIAYEDKQPFRWKHLHKVFGISSLIVFILIGYSLFDPTLSSYIGGIIEINPTWNLSILLSLGMGICITGPCALISIIARKIRYYKIDKKERK